MMTSAVSKYVSVKIPGAAVARALAVNAAHLTSIILKKSLSRRTVLRGMGVSLALPLLDSMVPAFAAAGNRVVCLHWTQLPG